MQRLLVLIVAALASGCAGGPDAGPTPPAAPTSAPSPAAEATDGPRWSPGPIVVPGYFADPELAPDPAGGWRLYYENTTPAPDARREIRASRSEDGRRWTDEGEIRTGITFPDVVRLEDGRLRMYFVRERSTEIGSAVSSDGLVWEDDPGTRVALGASGVGEDGITAPTVVRWNGSWIMAYRGAFHDERYSSLVPNKDSAALLWATSEDGLAWTPRGMLLDAREKVLEGHVDGPEFAVMEGTLKLYFWGYKGVYAAPWTTPPLRPPPAPERPCEGGGPHVLYCPDPPADPTLGEVEGTWMMFTGQRQGGISYATRVG